METIGPRAMGEAGGSIKQGLDPATSRPGKIRGGFWKLFKKI